MRLFLSFLIVLSALIAAPAAAKPPCTCAESSFDNRFDRADVIFTGTVSSIEKLDSFVKPYVADIPVKVTLDINTTFKGLDDEKTFTLMTNLTRDTCTGHPFVAGEKYLVFSYRRKEGVFEHWSMYNFSNGTYDVGGLCGGTKKISDAKDDLEQLKKKLEK